MGRLVGGGGGDEKSARLRGRVDPAEFFELVPDSPPPPPHPVPIVYGLARPGSDRLKLVQTVMAGPDWYILV